MSGYEFIAVPIVMICLSFFLLALTLWIIRRPDKKDIFVDETEEERNRRFGEDTRDYPEDFSYQY
jgi:hypothetical protein